MAALTAARKTLGRRIAKEAINVKLKDDEIVYEGGLVMIKAGYGFAGATDTSCLAVGRAKATVDATGAGDGALSVDVEEGEFLWGNSAAADEITQAEVGTICWIVDDSTVAKTDGSSSRSEAGIVTGVSSDGVWVKSSLALSAAI